MIPHPTPAEPPSPADQAAEDADYYRRVLHELIDMGTDLARVVHDQAKAGAKAAAASTDAGAGTAPDLTAAFDRIARSVRRSIALARTLSDPIPPRAAHDNAARRVAARKRIIREVEDTIQRRIGAGEAEALHGELLDRLDAPDLDDDIRDRPVADIIADICRDLGLAAMPGTRPWKRRGPAELATLRARAARPPGATPGLAPSLAALPQTGGPADGDPAANDLPPGLTIDPTTLLLHAARFRGK